ncbi:unnamed protein product, partial [Thlaspi arvense]
DEVNPLVTLDSSAKSLQSAIISQVKMEETSCRRVDDLEKESFRRFQDLEDKLDSIMSQLQPGAMNPQETANEDGKSFPIFKGGDPRNWFLWLEIDFGLYGCSEWEKLDLAQSFMEGEAQEWFQTIQTLFPFQSWERLRDDLLMMFGNKDDPEAVRLQTERDQQLQEFMDLMKSRESVSIEAEVMNVGDSIQETKTVARKSLEPEADSFQKNDSTHDTEEWNVSGASESNHEKETQAEESMETDSILEFDVVHRRKSILSRESLMGNESCNAIEAVLQVSVSDLELCRSKNELGSLRTKTVAENQNGWVKKVENLIFEDLHEVNIILLGDSGLHYQQYGVSWERNFEMRTMLQVLQALIQQHRNKTVGTKGEATTFAAGTLLVLMLRLCTVLEIMTAFAYQLKRPVTAAINSIFCVLISCGSHSPSRVGAVLESTPATVDCSCYSNNSLSLLCLATKLHLVIGLILKCEIQEDVICKLLRLDPYWFGLLPIGIYLCSYHNVRSVKLLKHFRMHYAELATQKFSSHVVEKCLKHYPESRAEIARELLSVPNFNYLMQDPFGNYVIQTALTKTKGLVHTRLVEKVRRYGLLKSSPHCKKIFSKIIVKK